MRMVDSYNDAVTAIVDAGKSKMEARGWNSRRSGGVHVGVRVVAAGRRHVKMRSGHVATSNFFRTGGSVSSERELQISVSVVCFSARGQAWMMPGKNQTMLTT
ncbi:unnamed protein product [Calypogeia fissa]